MSELFLVPSTLCFKKTCVLDVASRRNNSKDLTGKYGYTAFQISNQSNY